MSDEKKPFPPPIPRTDSPPPQPPTTRLPAQTDRALLEDLTRVVKAGFAETREALVTQADSLAEFNQRLGSIESWKEEVDDRLKSTSLRSRVTSDENLKQDSAIAHIITEVGATKAIAQDALDKAVTTQDMLAANTAMTAEMKAHVIGFFKSPKVIFVGKVAWGAAMAYAAAKGLRVLP